MEEITKENLRLNLERVVSELNIINKFCVENKIDFTISEYNGTFYSNAQLNTSRAYNFVLSNLTQTTVQETEIKNFKTKITTVTQF